MKTILDKLQPATKAQCWGIFTRSGYDVRNCCLAKEQASAFIKTLDEGEDVSHELESLGAIQKKKVNTTDWQEVYDKAHAAGLEAGQNCMPKPMTVVEHLNPFDDASPIKQEWYVSEGVCGFAWIKITPGNCSFANWLKKNGLGSKSSQGGVTVWVHEFNQSYECKYAYARAFAKVVNENDVKAYAQGRLD